MKISSKLHHHSQPGPFSRPPTSTLKKAPTSGTNVQPQQSSKPSAVRLLEQSENSNTRALLKQNSQYEAREQRYIEKLSRLEEGLQNQYIESMKLQELYSDLLDSYKAKEEQIKELELRYRVYEESERRRLDVDPNVQSIRKDNQLLQELLEEHKTKIADLTKNLEETNTALANYKALANKSEDFSNSKLSASSARLLESVSVLQKENDNLREAKLVLQCQNDYLKNRNRDLQAYRQHIDRLTIGKQHEIARLRDQKIALLRSQNQKRINISPRTSPRDYSPTRQAQRLRLLQQQNKQLRLQLQESKEQACQLNSIVSMQRQRLQTLQPSQPNEQQPSPVNIRHDDFFSFSKQQLQQHKFRKPENRQPTYEWLRQQEQSEGKDEIPLTSSGARKTSKDDEQLPPFPRELEIDSLIKSLEKAQQRDDDRWEVADQ